MSTLRTALSRWRPSPEALFRLPGPIEVRLEGLRRDFDALTGPLRGLSTPPFALRDGAAYAHRDGGRAGAEVARQIMNVVGVDRLTPAAVCLHLARPDGAPLPFDPGQFLTLCVQIDGQEHRRAYSLCSDPTAPAEVAVAIKRVEGGLVSNHLVDTAAVGQALAVLGPSGSYGLQLEPEVARHVVLVSGGSGITPNLAIARGVLSAEPGSGVTLVYANRGAADVMFAREIATLAERWPDRLRVRELLEAPPKGWVGGVGRMDAEGAPAEIAALGAPGDAHWFLCGPTPMMDAVTAALEARGVPLARIHAERFTPAARAKTAATTPQALVVSVGNTQIGATIQPGQTVLEAGLAAGADMPYSCALGGCGACRVKLRAGEVVLDEPNCLTDRERGDGYVLACVSRPRTAVTVEVR